MGAPTVQRPIKPPAPPDVAKAQLNALAYADTERKLRRSTGRAGSFLTGAPVTGNKPLLGM